MNHVKKSKKCQEKYDMELLERESKKRSLELKKAKQAEEVKKHRAKKMLENPTEMQGKHAEEEKKSRKRKIEENQPETLKN